MPATKASAKTKSKAKAKPDRRPRIKSDKQTKAKRGIKTLCTPETTQKIAVGLMSGMSLRETLRRDDSLPQLSTVIHWLAMAGEPYATFKIEYERAREIQAEIFADEICDIADDGSNDWRERNDADNPGYELNGENIQRSRLRVDSRKWIASRILKHKFGDHQKHTVDMNVSDRTNKLRKAQERAQQASKAASK